MGKNDAAVELITKAIAIQPDYSEAHNNLGNIFKKKKKLNDGDASYHNVLAFNPAQLIDDLEEFSRSHFN